MQKARGKKGQIIWSMKSFHSYSQLVIHSTEPGIAGQQIQKYIEWENVRFLVQSEENKD